MLEKASIEKTVLELPLKEDDFQALARGGSTANLLQKVLNGLDENGTQQDNKFILVSRNRPKSPELAVPSEESLESVRATSTASEDSLMVHTLI